MPDSLNLLTFKLVVPVAVVMAASLVAAATDVWKYKVYNAVTLPLILTGFIYNAVVFQVLDGSPGTGLLKSLLGLLTVMPLFIPYAMGGVSAGDVKLMGGVGAWLGPQFTFIALIAACLVQGVAALLLIAYFRSFTDTWMRIQILLYRLLVAGRFFGAEDSVEKTLEASDRRGRAIPFGAMAVLGILIAAIYLIMSGAVPSSPK